MLELLKTLLANPVVQKLIRNKLLYRFMETKFYNWLLHDVLPKLRLSNSYTEMDGLDVKWIQKLAKPGDILLSVDYKNITTAIIGGEFAHAGFVTSNNLFLQLEEVSEMVAEGYHETHLNSFCFHSDRVALLRVEDPRWIPK